MIDIDEEINKIIAAMLTIAWASTKDRETSQSEIKAVYENFGGKNK